MFWFRRLHLLGLVWGLLVIAVLSLSDTAPGTVAHLIRSVAMFAVQADPFGNVQHLAMAASGARAGVPYGADTVGHFLMWGAVGFVATGLLATVRDRLSMMSALFLLSSLFEAGQEYLSWSRTASLDDLVANGVGLLVGFSCYTIAEALALPRLSRRNLGL
ncbi:MAG: VanZ family protein [Actinomycetota bacterium]